VLPNGKTNLIALDLGAAGDPIKALERVLELARTDLVPHIVSRELISLSARQRRRRPVLGMFLGGAGLADTILFCRHKSIRSACRTASPCADRDAALLSDRSASGPRSCRPRPSR
jgi:hypothetical protein